MGHTSPIVTSRLDRNLRPSLLCCRRLRRRRGVCNILSPLREFQERLAALVGLEALS